MTGTGPTARAPDLSDDNDGWPVINVGPGPVIVGRDVTCNARLDRGTISRFHCRIQTEFGSLQVVDEQSRFGTFVNGVRVHRAPLRLNDILRFGSSPPYRFDGRRLHVASDEIGVAIAARGLGIVRKGRTILENVDFRIPGGAFVCVLGPSGTGKSMLLGCLASTVQPSTGRVEFGDGIPVAEQLDYYRSKTGSVPQEDLIHLELTVAENLMSAAALRVTDPATAGDRIAGALRTVGLISEIDQPAWVLSGGQKKRVSIAIELLTRPRLLLLDEPTSGLDPLMQTDVMEALRSLSRQGVTVICTTHTLETVHYCDSVLVLGKAGASATVRYLGDPSRLLQAFKVSNQADLFEQLKGETEAQTGLSDDRSPTGPVAPSLARLMARSSRRTVPAVVVWHRSVLALMRDRTAVALLLGQPIALAVISLISQTAQFTVQIMFFLSLSALWLGMTTSIRELVRDRPLYVRDRLAGLKPGAYLAGKVGFSFTTVVVQTALLWSTAVVTASLLIQNNEANRLHHLFCIVAAPVILIAIGLGGSFLALAVSALAKTERAAVGFLPLLLIPQMLFGRIGFGIRSGNFNDPSMFGPIINGFIEDPNTHAPAVDRWVDTIASLPMITRPGMWSLDLTSEGPWLPFLAELIYLLFVILIYASLMLWIFRRRERTWLQLR